MSKFLLTKSAALAYLIKILLYYHSCLGLQRENITFTFSITIKLDDITNDYVKLQLLHQTPNKPRFSSIHATKAYGRRRRGKAPHILNTSNRWRCVVNFTPRLLYTREMIPVSTEQDAGWVPQSALPFGKTHKSLSGAFVTSNYAMRRVLIAGKV